MSRLSGYYAERAWNPGSVNTGARVANTITVPGAKLGDFCLVSFAVDVTDLTLTADVTGDDTVTFVLNNNTGGAVDLAEATLRVKVVPFDAI